MKMTSSQIAEIRNEHRRCPYTTNGYIPVIVVTQISARKNISGVQFWTAAEIQAKTRKNHDHTVSTYITDLHEK